MSAIQANAQRTGPPASDETLAQFHKWSTTPHTDKHAQDMQSALEQLVAPDLGGNTHCWVSSLEDAFVFGIETCVTNFGYLVRRPHVVVSLESNPAVVDIVQRLVTQRRCEASFLKPEAGRLQVTPAQYTGALTKNTCAICVPMMNYWTGNILDTASVAAARDARGLLHKVPLLVDIAPLWGRYGTIDLEAGCGDMWFFDFMSVSGLPGLACCLVRPKLYSSLKMQPLVRSARPHTAVMAATFAAWRARKPADLSGIPELHRMLSEYQLTNYTRLVTPPTHALLLETDTDCLRKLLKKRIIADPLPAGCPYVATGALLHLSFSSLTVEQAHLVFAALTL